METDSRYSGSALYLRDYGRWYMEELARFQNDIHIGTRFKCANDGLEKEKIRLRNYRVVQKFPSFCLCACEAKCGSYMTAFTWPELHDLITKGRGTGNGGE